MIILQHEDKGTGVTVKSYVDVMHEDLLHQSEENVNSNCFTWSRVLKKISALQYNLKGITRRLRKDVDKKK